MQNIFTRTMDKKKDQSGISYDIVVIGSGSGMLIVENAIENGLSVALVDEGPAGGTCLNVGCIPSKMLIAVADRVTEIREAARFGIKASVNSVDFTKIMEDMRGATVPDHRHIHQALKSNEHVDYYEGHGQFVDAHKIRIGNTVITGEKIFIASGARPLIPPIQGLENLDYLTNESILELDDLPESLIIIGGGYIAAEYGHFFSALGTDTTIIENADRILPREEPETSEAVTNELSKRMTIKTSQRIDQAKRSGNGFELVVTDSPTGKRRVIKAEKLLVAAGRRSNADLLGLENTGIETDAYGFIVTDDYLQTTQKDIWAFGDSNGKHMFTHIANAEADQAWHNAMHEKKEKMNYSAAPRAIFTWPQVASVGMTEAEARGNGDIMVGKARYDDAAKGMALREDRGFAKVIVDRQKLTLLGFHIVGPYAPILIQEVVNAMALGGQLKLLFSGIHIHPAMSELIAKTFSNLE